MAGLMLSLKPHEKFLINGTVLQNGGRKSQLRIEEDAAKVLRLTDALHPDDVNTPVKRAYYIVQLILSRDVEDKEAAPQLLEHLRRLMLIFTEGTGAGFIHKALCAAERGRYYSSLCHLKRLLVLEGEVLLRAGRMPVKITAEVSALHEKKVA